MTKQLSLKELEDHYTKKIKAVDYSKIVDELKKELHKHGLKPEKKYLDAIITSIKASNNVPLAITHRALKDRETALARAIAIQHKHDSIDDQIEASKVKQKYRFSGDKLSSLEDVLGKIVKEDSTGDFLTFLKDGQKPSIVFRGSVTDVKDPRFKGDWTSNFKTLAQDNETAINRDQELKRIDSDLLKLNDKYGGFKEFAGYSRGGYLTYRLAEGYNVGNTTTFNPHLLPFFKVGLSLPKGVHTLIRTVGDVASAPYAFIQSKGIKYKSLGEINGLDTNDVLDSHNLRNFTHDFTERTQFNKEALKTLTLGRLLVAKNKLKDAFKARRPTGAYEFEELQPSPEERYAGILTRDADKLKGIQAFTTKRARIAPLAQRPSGAFTQEQLQLTPDELLARTSTTRGTSTTRIRPRAQRPRGAILPVEDTGAGTGIQLEEQPSTSTTRLLPRAQRPRGAFPVEDTGAGTGINLEEPPSVRTSVVSSIRPSPTTTTTTRLAGFDGIETPISRAYQQGVMQHLNNQIQDLNSGIKGYTIRGLRAGASQILRPSNIAGLGAGLLVGQGISAIEEATGLSDKISQPVNDAIVGGLAGGAGTAAGLKIAGQALSASRIGTGVLSGGIGLLVGDAVTNSVGNLFSADANPYAKHIISNVVGGETGTLAGIATEQLAQKGITYAIGAVRGATTAGQAVAETAGTAGAEVGAETGAEIGVEAGLAGAEAGEASALAADSWNPTAVVPLVALALTAVASGVVGIFQGGQDAWRKQQEQQATDDYNKEVDELNYAGKAMTVRGQYKGMRDYLQSLGADSNTIGKLNNDLIDRLKGGATQLTPQELSQQFSSYLSTWHQPSNLTTYSGGEQISQPEQLRVALQRRSIDNSSVLNSLVNRLNSAGASVKAPPVQLYSPQTYAQQYNAILDQAGTAVTQKLGLNKLNVPQHAQGLDTQQVVSSVPSQYDAGQTGAFEKEIESKIDPTPEEKSLNQVMNVVSDPFGAIGKAIAGLVANNKATPPPSQPQAPMPPKPNNQPLAPKLVAPSASQSQPQAVSASA